MSPGQGNGHWATWASLCVIPEGVSSYDTLTIITICSMLNSHPSVGCLKLCLSIFFSLSLVSLSPQISDISKLKECVSLVGKVQGFMQETFPSHTLW